MFLNCGFDFISARVTRLCRGCDRRQVDSAPISFVRDRVGTGSLLDSRDMTIDLVTCRVVSARLRGEGRSPL